MDQQQTITPPDPGLAPKRSRFQLTKNVFNKIGDLGTAMGKVFSFIFYLILITAFLGAGGIFGSGSSSSVEKLYGDGETKIAVFDISGILLENTSAPAGFAQSSTSSSRDLINQFELIKSDEQVKAILLRINSPGGSVTAAEEMYQTIVRYKKELNLPIVVSMSDTAASGGYYIALAGDHIFANDTTLTGSIGAIIQTYNVQQLADRYGVQNVVVSSGPNKDLLNPFRPVSPDQVQLLQGIVDEAYNKFLARIRDSRQIDDATLTGVADGRILSGLQAKSVNLIDQTGSFHDAVTYARQQVGDIDAQVVVFGQEGFLDSLLGVLSNKFNLGSQLPLPAALTHLSGHPAYLYMN